MANKLEDLEVTKVDFVDQGDNKRANLLLFKRKPGEAAAEPKQQEKVGGFFRSVVAAIAKSIGATEEQVDAAMEEIAKGGQRHLRRKNGPAAASQNGGRNMGLLLRVGGKPLQHFEGSGNPRGGEAHADDTELRGVYRGRVGGNPEMVGRRPDEGGEIGRATHDRGAPPDRKRGQGPPG